MDGEREDVLPEGVCEEEGVLLVVPHPQRPVCPSRHHHWLPQTRARIHHAPFVQSGVQW